MQAMIENCDNCAMVRLVVIAVALAFAFVTFHLLKREK